MFLGPGIFLGGGGEGGYHAMPFNIFYCLAFESDARVQILKASMPSNHAFDTKNRDYNIVDCLI